MSRRAVGYGFRSMSVRETPGLTGAFSRLRGRAERMVIGFGPKIGSVAQVVRAHA